MTTTIPADVARARPPIDLTSTPEPTDPAEVARWWVATYTAHVGAEPAADLAGRLEAVTASELAHELHAAPPAASYSAPTPIVGVSTSEPTAAEGSVLQVRVAVETPGALVVYDIQLTQPPGQHGWLVGETTRI